MLLIWYLARTGCRRVDVSLIVSVVVLNTRSFFPPQTTSRCQIVENVKIVRFSIVI